MMSTTAAPLMTAEEMLALPDNGMERDLIDGQLRERPMTKRGRPHSEATISCGALLRNWLMRQPSPRGSVSGGEAGFRLRRNPDTTVGIDVAYISAELASRTPRDVFLIDGVPVLAVEILSPSDTHEDIVEKIELYLETGVRVVWIVDPDLHTVTVYRPDAQPVLYSESQELLGNPDLPGFRMKVAELFDQ
jgi:Uma2 family endonuclease